MPATGGKKIVTSGTTPISTTDDTPVTLIPAQSAGWWNHLQVENGGPADGFICIGDGADDDDWIHLPARGVLVLDGIVIENEPIKLKRRTNANVSNVYAVMWR